MKKTTLILSVTLVKLAFFSHVQAQDIELERIVVTPSRTEEGTAYQQINTEVLENADLEKRNKLDLGEALNLIPGLDVVGGGKFGSASEGVYIRGALTRHTAYMLEGIKIYDPSNPSGYYVPADFLLSGLKKIEIIKTPLSAIYGSSPLGGAINFFVKRPQEKPYVYFETQGGSFYTSQEQLELGGKLDSLSYLVNVARLDTEGFSKAKEKNNNPEKDPYQNTNLLLNLDYEIDDNISAGFIAKAIHARTEIDDDDNWDGIPEDDEDNTSWNNELINSIYLKHKLLPWLSYKIQGGYTALYRRTQDDTEEYTRDWYKGQTCQLLTNMEVNPFDFYKFLIGFDYLREKAGWYGNYSGFISALKRTNNTKGFFWENILTPFDALTLNYSYRRELNPLFKDHAVIKGGLSYKLPRMDTELYSSYSEGFKAPSIFQLFSSSGNRDLKPEESKSWEVGFTQPLWDKFVLSFAYFHYNLKNLIDFIYSDPQHNAGRYENAAKAKSRGLETKLQVNLSHNLSCQAGYTYLQAEQDFVDEDSTTIFRRSTIRIPKHKAFLGASYEHKKFSVSLDLAYVGRRLDRIWKFQNWVYFDEFVTLKPYLLGNISLSYNLFDNAAVFIKVNNIFHKDYERLKGFQEENTSVYSGFKIKF